MTLYTSGQENQEQGVFCCNTCYMHRNKLQLLAWQEGGLEIKAKNKEDPKKLRVKCGTLRAWKMQVLTIQVIVIACVVIFSYKISNEAIFLRQPS